MTFSEVSTTTSRLPYNSTLGKVRLPSKQATDNSGVITEADAEKAALVVSSLPKPTCQRREHCHLLAAVPIRCLWLAHGHRRYIVISSLSILIFYPGKSDQRNLYTPNAYSSAISEKNLGSIRSETNFCNSFEQPSIPLTHTVVPIKLKTRLAQLITRVQ